MSSLYRQLLDAVVAHLEDLKSTGTRHVLVSPDNLHRLISGQAGNPTRSSGSPGRPSAHHSNSPTSRKSPLKPSNLDSKPKSVEPVSKQEVDPDLFIDPGRALEPEEKEREMARIRERALQCVKCTHLAQSRTQVVFGVGNVHAELMFVGEAPGMDEDRAGEPFVGKAGQLLTKIIQAMALSRETVYIANVLKCRPDTPHLRYGNRKPTLEEMNTCKPYLQAQVNIIRPRIIVALGATAVEGLLGRAVGIMKLRGNWQDFNGIPLMPTYHPAYLLRNQSPLEKRKVWEDMLAVMERLEMPISEKQRNFFLKKN